MISNRNSSPSDRRKPNLVFILIDDLGWVDTGCYGSEFYKTPNIDRLAAQGMKFTNGYASSPVCSPTRASLMTGKYPARLHLTGHTGSFRPSPSLKLITPTFAKRLSHDEVVIANALKPAGYTSAIFGKWDLGEKPYFPEDHGFDLSFGAMGGGMVNSHFYPWDPNWKVKGKEGEYLADRLTQEAESFIERNKMRPFFLYLSHYCVHVPHEAKKEIIAKYQAKAKPDRAQHNAVYAAMVESIDDSVGRIMQKLDKTGLADCTVIFFTSDNGGLHVPDAGYSAATSNAPLREGKGYLYEGGIREPLIVRWPGAVKPGSVCKVPASSIDFYPTMLELAGVKPRPEQAIDGESLVPALKHEGHLRRDALYWHYPHYSPQGGKPSSAMRIGDYKLLRFYEDDHLELYNLKDDIGEKHDLAEKMPEKAAIFRNKLDDWLKSVNAQMPTRNPDYRP